MITLYLFAGTLLIVLLLKRFYKPGERCPECGRKREEDEPICPCGWVFEYPDDDAPLEYGDPDDFDGETEP